MAVGSILVRIEATLSPRHIFLDLLLGSCWCSARKYLRHQTGRRDDDLDPLHDQIPWWSLWIVPSISIGWWREIRQMCSRNLSWPVQPHWGAHEEQGMRHWPLSWLLSRSYWTNTIWLWSGSNSSSMRHVWSYSFFLRWYEHDPNSKPKNMPLGLNVASIRAKIEPITMEYDAEQ